MSRFAIFADILISQGCIGMKSKILSLSVEAKPQKTHYTIHVDVHDSKRPTVTIKYHNKEFLYENGLAYESEVSNSQDKLTVFKLANHPDFQVEVNEEAHLITYTAKSVGHLRKGFVELPATLLNKEIVHHIDFELELNRVVNNLKGGFDIRQVQNIMQVMVSSSGLPIYVPHYTELDGDTAFIDLTALQERGFTSIVCAQIIGTTHPVAVHLDIPTKTALVLDSNTLPALSELCTDNLKRLFGEEINVQLAASPNGIQSEDWSSGVYVIANLRVSTGMSSACEHTLPVDELAKEYLSIWFKWKDEDEQQLSLNQQRIQFNRELYTVLLESKLAPDSLLKFMATVVGVEHTEHRQGLTVAELLTDYEALHKNNTRAINLLRYASMVFPDLNRSCLMQLLQFKQSDSTPYLQKDLMLTAITTDCELLLNNSDSPVTLSKELVMTMLSEANCNEAVRQFLSNIKSDYSIEDHDIVKLYQNIIEHLLSYCFHSNSMLMADKRRIQKEQRVRLPRAELCAANLGFQELDTRALAVSSLVASSDRLMCFTSTQNRQIMAMMDNDEDRLSLLSLLVTKQRASLFERIMCTPPIYWERLIQYFSNEIPPSLVALVSLEKTEEALAQYLMTYQKFFTNQMQINEAALLLSGEIREAFLMAQTSHITHAKQVSEHLKLMDQSRHAQYMSIMVKRFGTHFLIEFLGCLETSFGEKEVRRIELNKDYIQNSEHVRKILYYIPTPFKKAVFDCIKFKINSINAFFILFEEYAPDERLSLLTNYSPWLAEIISNNIDKIVSVIKTDYDYETALQFVKEYGHCFQNISDILFAMETRPPHQRFDYFKKLIRVSLDLNHVVKILQRLEPADRLPFLELTLTQSSNAVTITSCHGDMLYSSYIKTFEELFFSSEQMPQVIKLLAPHIDTRVDVDIVLTQMDPSERYCYLLNHKERLFSMQNSTPEDTLHRLQFVPLSERYGFMNSVGFRSDFNMVQVFHLIGMIPIESRYVPAMIYCAINPGVLCSRLKPLLLPQDYIRIEMGTFRPNQFIDLYNFIKNHPDENMYHVIKKNSGLISYTSDLVSLISILPINQRYLITQLFIEKNYYVNSNSIISIIDKLSEEHVTQLFYDYQKTLIKVMEYNSDINSLLIRMPQELRAPFLIAARSQTPTWRLGVGLSTLNSNEVVSCAQATIKKADDYLAVLSNCDSTIINLLIDPFLHFITADNLISFLNKFTRAERFNIVCKVQHLIVTKELFQSTFRLLDVPDQLKLALLMVKNKEWFNIALEEMNRKFESCSRLLVTLDMESQTCLTNQWTLVNHFSSLVDCREQFINTLNKLSLPMRRDYALEYYREAYGFKSIVHLLEPDVCFLLAIKYKDQVDFNQASLVFKKITTSDTYEYASAIRPKCMQDINLMTLTLKAMNIKRRYNFVVDDNIPSCLRTYSDLIEITDLLKPHDALCLSMSCFPLIKTKNMLEAVKKSLNSPKHAEALDKKWHKQWFQVGSSSITLFAPKGKATREQPDPKSRLDAAVK